MQLERPRAVIVGFCGAFGRVYTRFWRDAGYDVVGIDTQIDLQDLPDVRACLTGDIAAPSDAIRRAICEAQLVFLATPEPAIRAAIPVLYELIDESAVLIDIASVKRGIALEARKWLPKLKGGHLSLHPLFGPDETFAEQNFTYEVLRDTDSTQKTLRCMQSRGGCYRPMTADEHDRHTAFAQALPHALLFALGACLKRSGKDYAQLLAVSTPTQRCLLTLMQRVVDQPIEVTRAIQAGNPHARAARASLLHGLGWFDQLASGGSDADFQRFVADMRAMTSAGEGLGAKKHGERKELLR